MTVYKWSPSCRVAEKVLAILQVELSDEGYALLRDLLDLAMIDGEIGQIDKLAEASK